MKPMRLNALSFAIGLAALQAAAPVAAVDSPEPPPPPAAARTAPSPLAAARALIADRKYDEAAAALRRAADARSADWNNLMGLSLRRSRAPDLAGAQRHYDAALQIDPQHRGALEYAGELALMRGDLPRAEARLAELQRACGNADCDELRLLRGAIERYKAAGNRYLPTY